MADEFSDEVLLDRLLDTWEEACAAGNPPSAEELCADCPQHLPEIRRRIGALLAFGSLTPTAGLLVPDTAAPAVLPALAGYEIDRELGRGGMGVVYLGRHPGLNRAVAIKMILAGTAASPAQRERFLAEARAVARLRHPNIVQIHDVGEVAGQLYLVMEYLPGGDLEEALAGRPQPPREAACLIQTLARAIQHAHDQGIIHRDLKPSNILLVNGVPKVTDFGLAKQLDAPTATASDAVVGTASYMAPEQARGSREVGPACDTYALGAILYECLTGRPPFPGTHFLEILERLLTREPIAPRRLIPNVPRDLETICLKCLAKDPRRRYASAAELADDLGRFLSGLPVRARPVGRIETAWRWCVRNPVVAGLSTLVVVALLAVAGISAWFAVQSARSARDLRLALTDARIRLAETEQARGLGLLEAGETDLGLLWLGRALEHLPPGSDDLDRELRRTLGQALQCQRPLQQRLDNGRSVQLLAPSPDGALLVTAGGSQVRFWNAATGQPHGEPFDYGSDVLAVAWHPSGREVALGGAGEIGQDTRIVRLNPATGRPLDRVPTLASPRGLAGLAWNPAGTLLAAAAFHLAAPDVGELSVWSGPEMVPLVMPTPLPGAVVAMAHHPHRDLLAFLLDRAVGDRQGGTVLLLDPRTGKPVLPPVAVPEKPILFQPDALVFAPDGDSLWTMAGNRLRRWGLDGKLLDALPSPRERSPRVAFHPTGVEVRVVEGGVARGYSPRTGAALDGPIRHGDRIAHLVWADDGERLLSASADHSVAVWGAPPHPVRIYPDQVTTAAFSPDGGKAFTGSDSGAAHLWVRKGADWRTISLPNSARVEPSGFSADGRVLLTVSQGRQVVRRWDAREGTPLGEPITHPAVIAQLAISPTGDRFATTSSGVLRLYGTSTGERLASAQLIADSVLLQFTEDGARILVLTQSRVAGVLAQEFTVDPLAPLADPQAIPDTHSFLFERLAASPDGRVLAYRADGGHFQVFDRKKNQVVYRGASGEGKTTLPAFHPHRPLVVVGAENGVVTAIDWRRGEERTRVIHGSSPVRVLLPPDGATLITVGTDGAVRQWDLASGAARGTAWRHADAVGRAVSVSPDGRWLLTGSRDGAACLRDREGTVPGSPAEVCRELEKRTGLTLTEAGQVRVLTVAEWRQR